MCQEDNKRFIFPALTPAQHGRNGITKCRNGTTWECICLLFFSLCSAPVVSKAKTVPPPLSPNYFETDSDRCRTRQKKLIHVINHYTILSFFPVLNFLLLASQWTTTDASFHSSSLTSTAKSRPELIFFPPSLSLCLRRSLIAVGSVEMCVVEKERKKERKKKQFQTQFQEGTKKFTNGGVHTRRFLTQFVNVGFTHSFLFRIKCTFELEKSKVLWNTLGWDADVRRHSISVGRSMCDQV